MVDKKQKYDAITLDTSVFVTKDKNIDLESGLIGNMKQFRKALDDHAKFILSEIVYEEILSRMKIKIKKAKENIIKSMNSLKTNKLLSDKEINKIETLFNSFPLDEEAKNILKLFKIRTGCRVIKYDNVKLKNVFKKYFQQQPPFGEGKKRHEFPDAVALMSLEQWAEKNEMHVLAVSKDPDWVNYAKESQWIDVEEDLGKALEKFQEQKAKIRKYVENLLLAIHNVTEVKLFSQMNEKIKEPLNDYDINVKGESSRGFYTDGILNEIDYLWFSYSPDVRFSVVNTQKDLITFSMWVDVEVDLNCFFDLYRFYDVSESYIKTIEFTKEIVLPVLILVTITGTSSLNENNFDDVDISNIEVINIRNVDLGIID